jgi:hypothetical protein
VRCLQRPAGAYVGQRTYPAARSVYTETMGHGATAIGGGGRDVNPAIAQAGRPFHRAPTANRPRDLLSRSFRVFSLRIRMSSNSSHLAATIGTNVVMPLALSAIVYG